MALLSHADLGGPGASSLLDQFKLDPITPSRQVAAYDVSAMNKDVGAAVVGSDEPKAFALAEPLYDAGHGQGVTHDPPKIQAQGQSRASGTRQEVSTLAKSGTS